MPLSNGPTDAVEKPLDELLIARIKNVERVVDEVRITIVTGQKGFHMRPTSYFLDEMRYVIKSNPDLQIEISMGERGREMLGGIISVDILAEALVSAKEFKIIISGKNYRRKIVEEIRNILDILERTEKNRKNKGLR